MLGVVGHGKVAASGDGKGDDSSSSSSSSSNSDSSDEHAADAAGGHTKQRLETMFSGQKRAAGGTSGSATGSGHGPGDNTRGKPANAGTAAGKSGSSKKSGSALGVQRVAAKPCISGSAQVGQSHLSETPSHEAVNMDGRNKRLREPLEKSGKECVSEIPTLTKFFHDEETCVWDDPASREKTKKAATEIKKHATKLVANQKLGVKRFGNASAFGQAAAEEAKKVLDENLEFLAVILDLLNLLVMPQPPLDDFITAMDDMTSRGVRFTKSLYKYAYWLKARSLMLFERYDELCAMSTYANFEADLQKLIDCHMPECDALDYASIVLQQCMSERINAISDDKSGLPPSACPEKKAALAMLDGIKKHSLDDGFAAVGALPSMNEWIAVLDLLHADPFVVCDLVKEYANNPKSEFSSTDILSQLMYTTKLGQRLLDCAVAWVKDETNTLEVSQRIRKVESLIGEVLLHQPNMADEADMNRDTIDPDYIQFFDAHVGPAETLVEEVLAHESVSDKVALEKARS